MNRERAEAHLRLLAEDELRRAATLVPDGPAGSTPDQAMRRASAAMLVHYHALVRLAALLVRDTRAAGTGGHNLGRDQDVDARPEKQTVED
jgi:hypothetical protein